NLLQTKWAFTVGIDLAHEFNSPLELSLQIDYSRTGFKAVGHSLNTDSIPPANQKNVQDVSLNYIRATVIPSYSVGVKKHIKIGIGGYFGYLQSQKLLNEIFINGVRIVQQGSRDDLGFLEYDAGISVQAGYYGTIQS